MQNQNTEHKFSLDASLERCRRLRRRILGISQGVQALHVAGAFSCIEILDAIYFHLMRFGKQVEISDSFIMSKGHGAIAQYVILEELGILSEEDLNSYGSPDGVLGDHPYLGLPGIDASSGSLGHGLPTALGMALSDQVFQLERLIYVVMSDGEMQEGSVWEAMMVAPSFNLTNIVAVVDLNDRQSFAKTSEIHPNFYPLISKGESFGWEVIEVDGHNVHSICNGIMSRSGNAPQLVVAKTIKGKGVSYMEDVPIWHYRSPSRHEYQMALKELKDPST